MHITSIKTVLDQSTGLIQLYQLVSPVGGPHSLRGVVGAAVVRNYRKTGVHAKAPSKNPPPFFSSPAFWKSTFKSPGLL